MAKRRRKSKDLARREKEAEQSKKFAILLAVIGVVFFLIFIILRFI
ncbi:MAG: hypothetical protein ACNA8W_10885 [Bradymonadaceae bacterium]